MSRYRFVEAERGRYPVTRLWWMAKVSRAACYQLKEGRGSARQAAEAVLTIAIRAIHAASRGSTRCRVCSVGCGPRATTSAASASRSRWLRRGSGGLRPPRWVRTTTPEPTAPAISGRAHGAFTAPAPDVLWVGDITYLRTREGWLHLATVLDVFSRRVIGWAVAPHLRTSLVCDVLRMAMTTRAGTVAGVINALAEPFFATYKLELIGPAMWPTHARARTATMHWLEAIHNRRRRHSALDMLGPVDYEERYWDRRAAA